MCREEAGRKENKFSFFFLSWKSIDNIYVGHGSVGRTDLLGVIGGVIIEVRSHTIVRETEEIKTWKGNWRIREVTNVSDKPSMPHHHSATAKEEFVERSLEIYCLYS